jgi:hypothetical protein
LHKQEGGHTPLSFSTLLQKREEGKRKKKRTGESEERE